MDAPLEDDRTDDAEAFLAHVIGVVGPMQAEPWHTAATDQRVVVADEFALPALAGMLEAVVRWPWPTGERAPRFAPTDEPARAGQPAPVADVGVDARIVHVHV